MIPKKNDHNIDNLRYILNAAYYTSVPNEMLDESDDRRAFSHSEDMALSNDAEYILGGMDYDD